MTNKTLKQIQEENRRAIIMACNPLNKMPPQLYERCKDNPEKHYKRALLQEIRFFDCLVEGYFLDKPDEIIIECEAFFESTYIHENKKWNFTKYIGRPLTLDRVLLCINKKDCYFDDIWFGSEDDNYTHDHKNYLHFDLENLSWDLTKSTLEEQSEETQRAINKLIVNQYDE